MAKSFNDQMRDRFTKITSDYGTINKYVHETAMMIAEHAEKHGDCSTAQGLVMALPASIRREMLILWFAKFTPIVVKNDDAWAAKMHPKDSKLFTAFDLKAGDAKPFYELAKAHKERPPLDYAALVNMPGKWAKQLETKLENGEVEPSEVETTKALIVALKAIRVSHINPVPANEEAPAEGGEEALSQMQAAA